MLLAIIEYQLNGWNFMEFKIERERENKFLRRENNSSYDSINSLVFVIRHVHCRDILLANCDIMRIIKRFNDF